MVPSDDSQKPVLLSIVVPVLNEEKLLSNTLALFTADIKRRYRCELVVSDGGSTDDSVTIAEQFADVVVQHTGEGQQTIAEGRDKGAMASHGKVIVFLNGDTVPNDVESFLAVVLEFVERKGRYAQASALACPVQIYTSERTRFDSAFHTAYNGWVWLLNALRIGAGRGECQIVRRDVYDAVGGYKHNLAAGEDFDLLARIGLQARVMFATELLVLESPRRFRRFGYFRILWWWTVNALSVMITGKSSSDEWEPVR